MIHEASSSTSFSSRKKYDVFLSFYGKDTRKNFTDHLYTALDQEGMDTFRDDEELKKGEDISLELLDAIEGSSFAIVVLSENYASSRWCLNELVKILECQKNGQTVLPVFYKVDPSHVRYQKETFEMAFVKHEERFKEEKNEERFKEEKRRVESWKAALTKVANLSGWDHLNVANGHEAKLIKMIVEEVSIRMKETLPLHVAKYPVGLNSHIERITCLLNDGLDVVRFIGIHGLAGIGKTTIAKAVFNIMFQKFEGSAYLANVREDSIKHNGLVFLQKKLLSDALKKKEEDISINDKDKGIVIIKKSLRHKRVLIVLDDVDAVEQLDKLAGEHGWFGLGSRIIITTRNEHLLNVSETDTKYKTETMNQNESLQLFSFHAFRQKHPLECYLKLSYDVVEYARGLPLALVILGSLLFQKSQAQWNKELEKLRKVLNNDIFEILEISYQALDDFNRKIFLDISCFFIGEDKDKVISFLDGCGLFPESGINLLIERSLVSIDETNLLDMHDLIRDMGRETVRKQAPSRLGERSRLWQNDDVLDVLRNFTGNDAVEGIDLQCMEEADEMYYHITGDKRFRLTAKAFFKMPNLRLLRISLDNIRWEICHEDWNLSFKNLVWFCWIGFPFKYIPDNFSMEKLVILEMHRTKLREVWKGTKHYLPKLKVLDLSYSNNLTCMPDFSRIPNLEKLILHSCGNLVEIPESIGHLSKLVELDLKNCWRLENLPIGISKLTSLEKLIISGCKIKRLPEGIGNLTRLTVLGAEYTTIEPLPDDEHEENIQLNGGYKLTIGCVKERIFEVTSEEFQNSKICDIYLPWSKIGEWLDIQEKTVSASCQFAQLPNMEIERVKIGEWLNIREKRVSSSRQFEQLPNAEIEGVIICILCRTNTYSSFLRNNSVAVLLHNQSKDCTWYHIVKYKTKQFNEDSIWVIKIPHCIWKSIADGGDIISVSVETDDRKYISIEIDIHMCYTMRGRHSHGMGSGLSEEYQMSYDRSESNCRSIVSLEVPLWDDDGSEGIPHQHDDVSNSNEQSHSPNNCLCFRWSCLRSKSDG